MQHLSMIAGFIAAALWFWSACVRLPTTITSGWGGAGGTAQLLGDRLRMQGRISAGAAAFSGLSVLFQSLNSLF
jgi:hypothetical protein